ncbi:MAG: heavy metal-binding domain-containing protein [Gemmatimonadetes bacterium]|nr:heavy metal-binding domain-containing protein [Candidatus Palauibacter australiensis]
MTMRRFASGMAVGALALAFAGSAAVAQELSEVCPDSPDMTGAMWGLVSDGDTQMGLPSATVVASWERDGESGQMEGQTALDGGYTLCYVPLGVEISVQPVFMGTGGAAITASLTEQITRLDLTFSLSAVGSGGNDDRIWACFGGVTDNQVNVQNTRLIRCDPGWAGIDRCPKEAEYGQVQATMTGGGLSADDEDRVDEIAGSSDFREALEKLVADAARLGANAMINVRMNRNSLTAEAVTISVDPTSCR